MNLKSSRGAQSFIATVALSLLVVAMVIFTSCRLDAAELDYATVERDDDRFLIDFRMRLSVPIEQLRDYLADVEQLARVSPTTVESEMIKMDGNAKQLLRIVLKPCVLIFCKRLTKVSHIHEQTQMQNFSRRYVVEQSLSDFRKATETLELERDGDGTFFRYRAELEPDFYVPSLIASWLIRRTLVEDLLLTATTVEGELIDDGRGH